MKLPCKADKTLPKICAKDSRESIQNPYLDADKKLLYATNGHILTRIPVETSETDVSGYVTLDAIKYAAAIGKASNVPAEISVNGSLDIGNTSFERPQHTFPDAERIYQETVDKDPQTKISFNARLLYELAAALSDNGKADGITLHINGSNEAILVISNDNPESTGIIMPVRNTSV